MSITLGKPLTEKSFSRVAIRPSDVPTLFEIVIEPHSEGASPVLESYTTLTEAFDTFVERVQVAEARHIDINLVASGTEPSPLTEAQWTKLVSAMRSASVEKLQFKFIDFSAIRSVRFHKILQVAHIGSFSMEHCVFNCGFITDAFVKKCTLSVHFAMNELRGGECLHVTEQGLLDFCFAKG